MRGGVVMPCYRCTVMQSMPDSIRNMIGDGMPAYYYKGGRAQGCGACRGRYSDSAHCFYRLSLNLRGGAGDP